MRVLRVHNRYQQRGGEDAVFEAEVALLRSQGVEVETLVVCNDDIPTVRSVRSSLELAAIAIWSPSGKQRVAEAAAHHRADIVHFDNTFPLISPAAYSVARQAGAAVVQSLHNFRLLCPNALFFRDGHPCDDCLGKTPPYPGIIHACYRDSRAQTGVVAAMLTFHRLRHTWARDVDRYVALSPFSRRKFIDGGLPGDRIVVKPNFVESVRTVPAPIDGQFLFVGRLAPEKGIATLVAAAVSLPKEVTVRVAGDGTLLDHVRQAPFIALGRIAPTEVAREMCFSQALIFPSEWFEGFPMTIAEAFANGLPVIASNLGAMAEIIEDGVTGLLFKPGDADDLAAKVRWANEHPAQMRRMGENARREYEAKYTPERNYEMLMQIYHDAIDHRRRIG